MRLRRSGERIFAVTQPSMNAMSYGNWLSMCYESLVRAAVVRYLLAVDGRDAALPETRAQQGRGLVWMDQLVSLLGEYVSPSGSRWLATSRSISIRSCCGSRVSPGRFGEIVFVSP
jgi:hypothetical protein